jgi:Ca-activated chloride channel homolog
LPLLGKAAAAPAGDPEVEALRPEALYNLGNAHLAAGDAAQAAERYRATLRLRPDHAPAKHNLELALRELQKQQQQQQQPQGGQGQQRQDPRGGQGRGEGDERSQGQPGPPDARQSPPPQEQGQGPRSPRLPSFKPQHDMSADQAAALLEAVENLEREQRRARAEQQRRERARTATEKDW